MCQWLVLTECETEMTSLTKYVSTAFVFIVGMNVELSGHNEYMTL